MFTRGCASGTNRVKNSIMESGLYGYYKIGEDCFLVRSESLERNRALRMLKFIDDDPLVHSEDESIIVRVSGRIVEVEGEKESTTNLTPLE